MSAYAKADETTGVGAIATERYSAVSFDDCCLGYNVIGGMIRSPFSLSLLSVVGTVDAAVGVTATGATAADDPAAIGIAVTGAAGSAADVIDIIVSESCLITLPVSSAVAPSNANRFRDTTASDGDCGKFC